MLKIKSNKLYINTFLVQMVVLILGFFTIQIATELLTTENFGIYNILKRIISLTSFPLLLGLGISIPKFVSINYTAENESNNFFIVGLIMLLILLSIYGIILLFLKISFFSIIGLGKTNLKLKIILFISVFGFCLYTFTYSYLKGVSNLKLANTINIIIIGIIPLLSLVFFFKNLEYLYYLNGISVLTITIFIILKIINKLKIRIKKEDFVKYAKKLLIFGAPRVFGEFALFGLFSIPIFLSANIYGLKYTAFLGLALSLFQLFAGMLEFVNIVLFPKIGALTGESNWNELKLQVDKILKISSIYCVISILITWTIAEPIILKLFGLNYKESVEILKILILGLFPYIFYAIIRNVLDIISDFPFNTINLVIGLLIIFFTILSKSPKLSIEICIVLGLVYIGFTNLLIYNLLIRNKLKKM